MSVFKSAIVLVAGLAVGFVAAQVAAPSGDKALEEQIKALTQRVEQLEKRLASMPVADGNPQLEQEAIEAYKTIAMLASTGKATEAKAKLTEFNAKYSSTKIARNAQRLAAELAVVGKDTPKTWSIDKWFQGQSDVKLDGPGPTLLVFWETWCPHCQREMPELQQVYDNYKGKGLQVVGLTKVSRSATEDAVRDFITQKHLGYPIAKETGALSEYFNVTGVPAAALLKGGKVVWRGHPQQVTPEMLQAYL
jgi:thiol-disulfide isomerase/thioredoxin